MLLGGPGGTGKSRVVKAAQAFAERWQVDPLVTLSATTGVAAVNVAGRTIHSCVGGRWFSVTAADPKKISSPRLANDMLLVIDDIKFFGRKDMCRLSTALRIAPFGASNMLFVGDFAQLPPVAGTALYTAAVNPETLKGLLLWRRSIARMLRAGFR